MKLKNKIGKEIIFKSLDELENFQGDLKELTDRNAGKLKKSIKEHGFIAPIFIWGNKILDGLQRKVVLKDMGYDKAPCIEILADDEKEAREILLLLSSIYGRINTDKLHEYFEINSLDFQILKHEIDLPEINMGTFEVEFYKDVEIKEKEIDELETQNKCPKCGYQW